MPYGMVKSRAGDNFFFIWHSYANCDNVARMPTGTKLPPTALTRAIAAVLSEAADERGVSQSEIARRGKGTAEFVSQPQLSRFFDGLKGIDLDQFNGICRVLEIELIDVIERAEARVAEVSAKVTAIGARNVGGRSEPVDLQTVQLDREKLAATRKRPPVSPDRSES